MSDRIRQSTDPQDARYRLRLSFDLGVVDLVDEALTSMAPTAQPTRVQGRVLMNQEEARWLHKALGELLEELDAEEGAEDDGPASHADARRAD